MFFLFEAFIQRPTETKSLVYFRATTATLFTLGFLAYVTFLGVEIYKDKPLLQLYQLNLTEVPVPDIEICSQSSPASVPHCDFQYRTWAPVTVYNNCMPWLQAEPVPGTEYCYLFHTDDQITFGDQNTSLFALNFYFQITNLTAAISNTVAIPALTVTLFDNYFNPLNTSNRAQWTSADYQEWRDIQNFKTSTSAIKGYTSSIRFTKTSYYAIREQDIGAIFGLTPDYDIVSSVQIVMENFPLHDSPEFSDTGLSGHFSVSLGQAIELVQREQRTHTVISALALAGGGWGVLFAIYTILFGHPRLAPWGFAHQIAFPVNKNKKSEWESNEYDKLPLVSPTVAIPGGSRDENDKRLEARVLDLESLLSDYFIDSGYLNKLRTRSGRRYSRLLGSV